MTFEQTALVLAWVAILALAFAMSGLLRLVHSLMRTSQRAALPPVPTVGTTVPPIAGLPIAARSVLLFADPGCGACDQAIEALTERARAGLAAAVLYREGPTGAHSPATERITIVPNAGRIFESLGVTATPTVVAIDAKHTVIASGLAGSAESFEQFLVHLDDEREAAYEQQ